MSKQYAGPKSKDVRDELLSIDSSLADLNYRKEYDVPSGFFDQQKKDVLTDIKGVDVAVKSRSIRQLWKPMIGVAAALGLGIIMLQNINNAEEHTLGIDDFDMATLQEYLIDETEHLDSDIAVDYDLIDIID